MRETLASVATRETDDDALRRRLGDRLRDTREYLGLKEEEVASCLAIPQTALSDIENGQRRVEAIELSQLARLYRQSVGFFAGQEERSPAMSAEMAQLVQQATGLSQHDRAELGRFANYLRDRSAGADG